MLKIRPIDCFCGDSTYVFILSAPSRHFTISLSEYDFFFGVSTFHFHSLMKSTFLISKRPLCLYVKQNNTWLL